TLSFSPKIDVTGYVLPPHQPPQSPQPPQPPVDTVAVIKISSPVGKKNREAEIKNDNVSVSWTCSNCPEGIRYTVTVFQYDGGKFRETRKNLSANSTSLKLSGGKYRITVSASNYSASSDTTCINVSTGGGGGWLVFLLLLAGGGGLGYYFWNKSRQSKIESTSTAGTDNGIFSGSGNSTNNSPQNHNSEYF
ncbi:MAG: hypothetical protein LBC19_03250, partial [Tannerella sp.]|nr:hypothetical protein [Tannerella sp.]